MIRVTIQGKPVIKIWESFTGWYWFGVEKVDSNRWYGLVRGFETEWGYWDDRELQALHPRIWEVREDDWPVCPLVEVREVEE